MIWAISLFLSIFLFFASPTLAVDSPVLFYGQGCSHCETVLRYLDSHSLTPELYEIYSHPENAALYNSKLDEFSIPINERGVPLLITQDSYIIGDQPIIDYFSSQSPSSSLPSPSPLPTSTPSSQETLPVSSKLTIFAVIAAAIVDAINPCAFAVLLILMTTVLASGKSKQALQTGVAFAASIFISYLLMGLGIYQALNLGGISQIFFKVIGYFAIMLGLFNLKDYFWYGKVFLMEVPLSWRPTMKRLLHSVTSPIGAFGIGFLVSLFLLPCTSGPYIVILGMLASSVTQLKAILYLVLYNFIFVSPMLAISYAVSRGYDPKKAEAIRTKRLRTLHLIAGILMLTMGILILR